MNYLNPRWRGVTRLGNNYLIVNTYQDVLDLHTVKKMPGVIIYVLDEDRFYMYKTGVLPSDVTEVISNLGSKPIDFSTDIVITSSNINTYNGATLTCTSAVDRTITVNKDAGITQAIAVCRGGNGKVTFVQGADVTINFDKTTNEIGDCIILDPRETANNFNCIGGVA